MDTIKQLQEATDNLRIQNKLLETRLASLMVEYVKSATEFRKFAMTTLEAVCSGDLDLTSQEDMSILWKKDENPDEEDDHLYPNFHLLSASDDVNDYEISLLGGSEPLVRGVERQTGRKFDFHPYEYELELRKGNFPRKVIEHAHSLLQQHYEDHQDGRTNTNDLN